jgi:hypothetical protein
MGEKADRFIALFKASGIPVHSVDAFGPRVIVTCWCEGTARKIARALERATFTINGIVKSVEYTQENRGTCLRPTTYDVWRVHAIAE